MPSKDMARYMRERREKRKLEIHRILGGVCNVCSATEFLDIDHVKPELKSIKLSGKGLDVSWSLILKELENCQLLCKPCHVVKTAMDLLPDHGTISRYFHRKFPCRCDKCRTIFNQRRKAWRKKKNHSVVAD